MRCSLCVSVVLLLPRFAMVLMEVGISDAVKDQGTLLKIHLPCLRNTAFKEACGDPRIVDTLSCHLFSTTFLV